MTMARADRALFWFAGAALLLAALAPAVVTVFAATPAITAPVLQLPDGAGSGVRAGDTEQFLGVPYGVAARWQAPAAAAPWRGARAFDTLPPRCPQTAAGIASGSEREDCLYLNVYRPAAAAAPRAVMVYVHGGGATNGSANDHDGSALAAQGGIIVVTVNYRLGALGFLQGGNYALEDVLLALRWVQRSAASLGGDPRQVTLAGESAGGTVICPLLAAPQARGLFQRAIISSDDCLHDVDTEAEAQQRTAAVQQRLHCDGPACMREAGLAQLVAAGGGAAPAIGQPGLLPDYAAAQIARHRWLRVPLLLGANRDEGRIAGPGFLHYDEPRYVEWLDRLLPPAAAAQVRAAYRDEHAGGRYEYAYKISAILTDSGMRGFGGCGLLPLAQAAAQDAPLYLYQFDDGGEAHGDGFHSGAAHAAELPYLWPDGGAFGRQSARFAPAQRRLSDLMIAHWAAFVRSGNPALAGQPDWPAFATQPGYRAFRPEGGVQLSLADYVHQHRCTLWRQLPVIMDRGEARP